VFGRREEAFVGGKLAAGGVRAHQIHHRPQAARATDVVGRKVQIALDHPILTRNLMGAVCRWQRNRCATASLPTGDEPIRPSTLPVHEIFFIRQLVLRYRLK
jgi:hypothetical protein